MPYYWTCSYCGANLDPGEKCNCQENTKEDNIHDRNENHVEAPDLAASILKLAEAIASGPDKPLPVSAYPTTPVPAAAPVIPAPVDLTAGPAPTTAAPTPSPTPVTNAPIAAPGNTPAPAVPVTGAPAYTLDQISRAGASLVDAGKMQQLLELLGRYGVQAVTQLKPEQYGAFATELRGLGAQI